MRRIGATIAFAAILLGSGSVIALAHARFDHSSPSPGQVLSAPPARVDIFTAQDMRKTTGANSVTVAGSDGSGVDDGNAVVDDANRRHISVGIKPNFTPGRYVVSFKTLSDEDGESDHGSFAFYVGDQPTNDQKQQDQKLTLTAQSDDGSTMHTGLYLAISLAAAVVVVIVAAALALLRRRRSP